MTKNELEATGEESLALGPEEVASALEARAMFYETLSRLYFLPLKEEQIEWMAHADFSSFSEINELFSDGANDMARYLGRRNSGTRQLLAVDFTAAFAGVSAYEGKVATPYKSVFTSEKGLMCQEAFMEVFQTYKAERIKVKDGLDWPDDHLSLMFQFMAIMSRRACGSYLEGDLAEYHRILRVSGDFLEQHIASWFDDFAAVAEKILETRFYLGVLKVTKGFIELDAATIADLKDLA